MIDDNTLRELLKNNNLTFSRKIRDDLQTKNEYSEIVEILSIIKKLNIDSNIIEKYPTILYKNSNDIKENYKLLKENNLYNYNQEELIQILLTDNELLRVNCEDLLSKYNNEEINKNILSLSSSIQRKKIIEKYSLLLSKEVLISVLTCKYSDDEVCNIISTCINYNIEVTPNVFKRNSEEIKSIRKICELNNINITDSVFTKTPKELEEVIKLFSKIGIPFNNTLLYCPMNQIELLLASIQEQRITILEINNKKVKETLNICERFNIEVDYKILKTDPDIILKVIELCNKYNVKVSKKMFDRTLIDIEEIIKYCKEKDIIVRETYFERTLEEIESIHNTLGLNLKREDATYKRSLTEIANIKAFCDSKKIKFTPVLLNNNLEEIEEIINTCNKRRIQVSNEVFKTNHKYLDRIISILKQQPLVLPFIPLACNRTPYEVKRIKEIVIESNVNFIPEMFLRTPYEVERIIKLTKNSLDARYFQYPLSKLEEVLTFCNNKNIKITPNMLNRTTNEIEDLIDICNNKNIEPNDSIYLRTPFELEEIINLCKENNIEITKDCFYKNPEQFKEIVETCKKLNIPVEGEVFRRTPDEIKAITKIYEKLLNKNPINNSFSTTPEEVEKIIDLLSNNNIEITGVVFRKKADELKDTIEFIKEKYGEEYLLPQIIIYDKDHLKQVFAYCKGRGCMDLIKTSPYILRHTISEIVDRDSYINSIGRKFIENNRFNQVFLWSKKKYLEEREKQNNNTMNR